MTGQKAWGERSELHNRCQGVRQPIPCKHSALFMNIERGQSSGENIPCLYGSIGATNVPQFGFATHTKRVPQSRPKRWDQADTNLADKNWFPKWGCQRTFWTQLVCSLNDRTTASSSSKRRSNTLITPSAKLASKTDDGPRSEAIAVTGLSELVSKSCGCPVGFGSQVKLNIRVPVTGPLYERPTP